MRKVLSSNLNEEQIDLLLDEQLNKSPQEMGKSFLILSVNNLEQNFTVTSPIQYFMKNIDQRLL